MDEQAESTIQTINEAELKERFGLEHVECCEDCHHEASEYGKSLIKVLLPEGNSVECCCNVLDAFKKIKNPS